MALELYMLGLITQDLDKSLEFYRQLGLALPEERAEQQHVSVKMQSGITFFLNGSSRMKGLGSPRVLFEFYLPDRASVNEKYTALTTAGYPSPRAPEFDETIGVYFSLITDPDGHVIMLTAD